MHIRKTVRLMGVGMLLAGGCAGLAVFTQRGVSAADNTGVISGVVTSSKGPEAGVWVIAETDSLQTKFRKIVVTNDQGRYLLPELPKAASYNVWVRGYGLADSKPVPGKPDQTLNLTAVIAKTPREAAEIYPASYWGSLIEPPKASEFPGTGPKGNGINPQLKTQDEFINIIKSCERCHQVGSKMTRIIPDKDKFDSAQAAWDHRMTMGQRGGEMSAFATRMGRPAALKMFADWTDRIEKGEVPSAPPRPQGAERNAVITMWGWNDEYGMVHDEMSTDRRNPRINANGPIYAVDWTNDWFVWVDPVNNTTERVKIPHGTATTKLRQTGFVPFRFFGEKPVWENPASPHNPMMDASGRVWLTTTHRPPPNPAWCKEGSDNKFAQYHPIERSGEQAGYYDPKTKQFKFIDTCFGTHHLQFAEDADNTLVFSNPGGQEVGFLNTKQYDQTGDAIASQGWCPTVLDTNGDGKITKPFNQPVRGGAVTGDEDSESAKLGKMDPKLDTRIIVGPYGIIVNPVDKSIWGSTDEVEVPGQIFRIDRGRNPPETCVTERYMLPKELGYRPRGIDIDRNGVIWTALAGSAHMASFDRRKCKVLNGAASANGRHCDEGWTFYKQPGPAFKGTNIGSEFNYYNWVDQFNTLGVGANTPIATGSGSDSLLVLNPGTKEWLVLRVPYPMGFHSRGMDGRIDDPNGGWKGRGVYATYGADAMWHIEGGPKEKNNLVKFQMRPDPLARQYYRRELVRLRSLDQLRAMARRPVRQPRAADGPFRNSCPARVRAPGLGTVLPTAHPTGRRPVDFDHASEVVQRFQDEATKWLYGLDDAARILSWAFFTLIPYTDKLRQTKALRQPHVLFKGPTGTGKTDLVSACAMAVDARFERIQGLPTYLPEDILGYETIVEELDGTRRVHFKPGKFMAHIVLIDEDNRLTAKTKAAVLEGMEESSVTLTSDYGNVGESKTIPLFPLSCDLRDIHGPRFFMVICTENVFGDEEGTFPNPVAQLDRTTIAINMTDPEDEEDELKIVARNVVGKTVEKLTNLYEVLDIAQFIFDNVQMSDYAQQYKVRLIRSTRPHRVVGRAARVVKEYLKVGISPRVHFHLEAVARTFAFFNGDTLITPDHIKAVAPHVLAHRLVLRDGMEFSVSREEVLDEVIRVMDVPPWT